MRLSNRGIALRYQQRVDSKLPMSRDCIDALDLRSTTLTSVAAAKLDSGLSITSVATTSTQWSGVLSSTSAADYTFELLWTFANGTVVSEEFQISVVDV